MAATPRRAPSRRQPQPGLFVDPIDVRFCTPASFRTADCDQTCRGVDGCEYAIKSEITGSIYPYIAHSEWFCTRLGELVGVPGPAPKVVRMPDGKFVFGSRWEGGVVNPSSGSGYWWDRVARGEIPLSNIKASLSRIYAFDHFIHNTDRHADNFLIRDQLRDHTVIAFDYSCAWVTQGFPLPLLPFSSTTVTTQRELSLLWKGIYIDKAEVSSICTSLKKISKASIKAIINTHPSEWLTASLRRDILSWWGSSFMMSRIDDIEKGVADGSYL